MLSTFKKNNCWIREQTQSMHDLKRLKEYACLIRTSHAKNSLHKKFFEIADKFLHHVVILECMQMHLHLSNVYVLRVNAEKC